MGSGCVSLNEPQTSAAPFARNGPQTAQLQAEQERLRSDTGETFVNKCMPPVGFVARYRCSTPLTEGCDSTSFQSREHPLA